jgi:hypothetical protein
MKRIISTVAALAAASTIAVPISSAASSPDWIKGAWAHGSSHHGSWLKGASYHGSCRSTFRLAPAAIHSQRFGTQRVCLRGGYVRP